ncbi:MAG: hypothetical protein QOE70_6494 [Chthoniobacter sp.]|jgi:hypothetical protein|nr:hypothetical protein [Chthoniobacter sp.]
MPSPNPRRRVRYAVLAILVVALGMLWRSRLVAFSPFLIKYGGDVLWAMMAFLGCGILMPKRKTWQVALVALIFAFGIEFSQLYHAPWIDRIRARRLGALILGSTFNWPDLPAYSAGIGLAAGLESVFRRRGGAG